MDAIINNFKSSSASEVDKRVLFLRLIDALVSNCGLLPSVYHCSVCSQAIL